MKNSKSKGVDQKQRQGETPQAKPSPTALSSGGPGVTPGPWQVEDGGFVGGPVGYGRICQMWNKYEEDFQNAEGNAYLIAAALDLYKACEQALGAFEQNWAIDWNDLKLALAKARGERK